MMYTEEFLESLEELVGANYKLKFKKNGTFVIETDLIYDPNDEDKVIHLEDLESEEDDEEEEESIDDIEDLD